MSRTARTVDICRQLAGGLAFSHASGFVHCDIKPANILMDKAGNPYIADFGLAIHEVNRVENGVRAGTPRYMPPEVVMGETHRIDGRADIWSLGVMMYEMLTGASPFRGTTQDELFDQIRYSEPRQPRALVPSLSRELERICLKCLSKSVLPRDLSQLSKAHRRFICDAVAGLAEQDRVVSILLAIFAEMFRDRTWTVAELTRVGGSQGVGYKFLESTFESMHANTWNRVNIGDDFTPRPVALLKPNRLGLFDMHGNCKEATIATKPVNEGYPIAIKSGSRRLDQECCFHK